MHYRILLIILFLSALSGQSLFNPLIGTDPFIGSPRSTAMGNTHLLNSTGSNNVRFNPANLGKMKTKRGFDFQLNRSSVFERWSMRVRDSFGEFLTHADYVANEFSYYDVSLGIFGIGNIPSIGNIGIGFNYAPLTHFTYQYSEEVRGSYSIEDGEYAGKDPIVGYQNFSTEGLLMMTSIGAGVNLGEKNKFSFGGAINLVQSTKLTDRVEVDTLYSDVTNLSTFPDITITDKIIATSFYTISTSIKLTTNLTVGGSWEEKMGTPAIPDSWAIDSTSGNFQYYENDNYIIPRSNYVKPEIKTIGISYNSNNEQEISIDFELNQVLFNSHLNLKDYKQFKFGFEYLTQLGTPIRGGLVYKTAFIPAMKPVSMFTFGSGKSIGNLEIDYTGTYCFQSFYHPDLFPVEGDIRPQYDLVRDSQLHLLLAVTYTF